MTVSTRYAAAATTPWSSRRELWAAGQPGKLSPEARDLIIDQNNDLWFSAASIWEITIKRGLGREDFGVEPHLLRRGLLENGYRELGITGAHTLAVSHLPPIHRDPFERLLVAQAETEGVLLVTADEIVARYPGPVRHV